MVIKKMTSLLSKKEVTDFQLWKCQHSDGRLKHPLKYWDAFTLFKMKNLISTKRIPDIKPDNSGEINQEATVLKKEWNLK